MDIIKKNMEKETIKRKYNELVASLEDAKMYDGRGEYNGYVCEKCGYITATLYKEKGVTPFIIQCEKCGKAIYNPQGKAGEYSEWACNFYTGCSNNCDYCYCKKGSMGKTWNEVPQLKKCFTDTQDALVCFVREMEHNIEQLRQVGVFFTFTSDPMLPGTKQLTWAAIKEALMREVPVQILTKRADFLGDPELEEITPAQRKRVAFGFTLTGHDELEPGADTNMMRVAAMVDLHSRGFYTFAPPAVGCVCCSVKTTNHT